MGGGKDDMGHAAWNAEAMEKDLQSAMQDGFLADVIEVQRCELREPKAVEPWNHLPFKLFKSETATRVINSMLDAIVPGTPATYNHILSVIMEQKDVESFCYLIGGQVRDILKGTMSKDIDFNYACTAQDVARVCVQNEWTVKYKAIGPVSKPNYVLIGDEQTDSYMEGFSISFNATLECFKQDFRQNMLFYDLTNHVILDKSGHGVDDVRNGELRLSCAPSPQFDDWAGADMTMGQKGLRYVKFVIRANMKQKPLKINEEECAFVVNLLRRAFRENAGPLQGFWFGYVLGECLATREGISALHKWVCQQADPSWWDEWLPFVQPKVGDSRWLLDLNGESSDSAVVVVQDGSADIIKDIFSAADKEGDGFINCEELKQVMLCLGLTEHDFNALAHATGYDGQGKLRYDDFVDHCVGHFNRLA